LRASDLEERDYYTEANVFWISEEARWEFIRNQAKQPQIGKIIDDALTAIESENPRLKGILDKRFARTQLEPGRLGELVDLISAIGFGGNGRKSKDVLGEVYEYFLGQFANAEGKKGGQFYTPASVVRVIVEMIAPHKGKVYDPCCGSGGMFVQSEKFVESHGGRFGDIFDLRAGEQPDDMAAGGDEPGHSRDGFQSGPGTCRYLPPQSASRSARRFCHGQSALQYLRLVERKARR
jgi:type I restriction-modification system DNA methylase subunit